MGETTVNAANAGEKCTTSFKPAQAPATTSAIPRTKEVTTMGGLRRIVRCNDEEDAEGAVNVYIEGEADQDESHSSLLPRQHYCFYNGGVAPKPTDFENAGVPDEVWIEIHHCVQGLAGGLYCGAFPCNRTGATSSSSDESNRGGNMCCCNEKIRLNHAQFRLSIGAIYGFCCLLAITFIDGNNPQTGFWQFVVVSSFTVSLGVTLAYVDHQNRRIDEQLVSKCQTILASRIEPYGYGMAYRSKNAGFCPPCKLKRSRPQRYVVFFPLRQEKVKTEELDCTEQPTEENCIQSVNVDMNKSVELL